MNVKQDISTGASKFQVEVIGVDGTVKAIHPFPPEQPDMIFHTDTEALNAFKQFNGQQNYENLHIKNLQNNDVLCQFVTLEGTRYVFVRRSFQRWGTKDDSVI
jgi:hypothetical protein